MTHTGDGDNAGIIVDLVQDPPVAYAHAPRRRLVVPQESASRRAGIVSEITQRSNNTVCNARSKPPDVALRRGGDNDAAVAQISNLRYPRGSQASLELL